MWLSERNETWRTAVDVVAMDEFTGFRTAAVEELKEDVTVVMDPFHLVPLAGNGLDLCRRRVQQHTRGHRGTRCVRLAAPTSVTVLSCGRPSGCGPAQHPRVRRKGSMMFAASDVMPFVLLRLRSAVGREARLWSRVAVRRRGRTMH